MSSTVTIHIAPMSFRVKVETDGRLSGTGVYINTYCRKFVSYEYNHIHKKYIASSIFRYYNKKTKEIYLPIYDLQDFKRFLMENGVSYIDKPIKLSDGKPVDVTVHSWFKPKSEAQAKAIEYLTTAKTPLRGLNVQTGGGKGNLLSERIKVPGGRIKMGDIKVGTTITAWDGTPTKVNGVYPLGLRDSYKITFGDGRATVVTDDHLWKCFYTNTTAKRQWDVRSTSQMKTILGYANNRLYIPLVIPEDGPTKDFPLDPYLLGYLIGNGSISKHSIGFDTIDSFVVEEFNRLLPKDSTTIFRRRTHWSIKSKSKCTRSSVVNTLSDLKLLGCRSWEKFIPEEYLHGSREQRESLMQGLMDSDGYIDTKSTCSYTSVSKKLADGVVYLVRSLGGMAHITEKRKYYTYKGKKLLGRLAYQVNIRPKEPSKLVRTPRKACRANDDTQYTKGLKLKVTSIEPDGKAEMQCISIDHPDKLYVTDDFIVTHNTAAFIKSAADLGVRTLIRVGGMVEQWAAAIKEYTKCTDDDIYIVQGMASVDKLLRGIDKKFKPKFIVASLRTLQGYAEDKENWSKFPDFDDFLNICKIGLVCIDEAHLNFHANFIMDLRWNSPITVPLTATFKVADPKIKEIFDLHYPQEIRFGSGVYKKYVEIRAVRYNGASPFGLPKSMFKNNKGYSQIKFEAWLLDKGRGHLSAFTKNCILPLVWSYYENRREDDERMLMLCTTRAMCDYYADVFKKEFPDRKIGIYVSGSPDEMLSTCDIILSTPGSAGTGRDIKRLKFCLNTISLRSEPTNEQILGRRRELPYSSVAPVFAYTYWGCIPSHLDHAQKREFLFMPLAKEFIQSEVF